MSDNVLDNLTSDMGAIKKELTDDQVKELKSDIGKFLSQYKIGLKNAKSSVKVAAKVFAKYPDNVLVVGYNTAAVALVESVDILVKKSLLYVNDCQNDALKSEIDVLVGVYDANKIAFDLALSLCNASPDVDTGLIPPAPAKSSDVKSVAGKSSSKSDDVDTGLIPPAPVKPSRSRNIEIVAIGVSLNSNQMGYSGEVWPDTCFVVSNVDTLIESKHVRVTKKALTHGK